MKTSYDPIADAFYAHFAPDGALVVTTTEVAPGVMLDLDEAGQMIGIEVLSVKLLGAGSYAVEAGIAAE